MFGNTEFAQSMEIRTLASEMKIEDDRFEEFYRSINRLKQEEFPHQLVSKLDQKEGNQHEQRRFLWAIPPTLKQELEAIVNTYWNEKKGSNDHLGDGGTNDKKEEERTEEWRWNPSADQFIREKTSKSIISLQSISEQKCFKPLNTRHSNISHERSIHPHKEFADCKQNQKPKNTKYTPSPFHKSIAGTKENGYSPNTAKGQSKIHREHMAVMSGGIDDNVKTEGLYSFIDKSIALRFYLNCSDSIQITHDDQMNQMCIINLSLHSKDNQVITVYCVASQRSNQHEHQRWEIKDEGFYSASEIYQKWRIPEEKLPRSDPGHMNEKFAHLNKIKQVAQLFAKKEMQERVVKKKWCVDKMPISKIIEGRQTFALQIRSEDFIEHVQRSCAELSMLDPKQIELELKPILVFEKDDYHIEYVQKIKLAINKDNDTIRYDVMISWKYDETKSDQDHNIIKPTGVHLHLEQIQSAYQLLTMDYSDDDNWFGSFQCGGYDISNTRRKNQKKKQNENSDTSSLQRELDEANAALERGLEEIEKLKRQLEGGYSTHQNQELKQENRALKRALEQRPQLVIKSVIIEHGKSSFVTQKNEQSKLMCSQYACQQSDVEVSIDPKSQGGCSKDEKEPDLMCSNYVYRSYYKSQWGFSTDIDIPEFLYKMHAPYRLLNVLKLLSSPSLIKPFNDNLDADIVSNMENVVSAVFSDMDLTEYDLDYLNQYTFSLTVSDLNDEKHSKGFVSCPGYHGGQQNGNSYSMSLNNNNNDSGLSERDSSSDRDDKKDGHNGDKRNGGDGDDEKDNEQTKDNNSLQSRPTYQQLLNLCIEQQRRIQQKDHIIQLQHHTIRTLCIEKHGLQVLNDRLLNTNLNNSTLLSLSVQTMQDVNQLQQENHHLNNENKQLKSYIRNHIESNISLPKGAKFKSKSPSSNVNALSLLSVSRLVSFDRCLSPSPDSSDSSLIVDASSVYSTSNDTLSNQISATPCPFSRSTSMTSSNTATSVAESQPSSLKDCTCNHLIYLISNHPIFNDHKINEFRNDISKYIQQNKIDGDTLSNTKRTEFSKKLTTFANNNRVRGPANKTWDRLQKFDFSSFDHHDNKAYLSEQHRTTSITFPESESVNTHSSSETFGPHATSASMPSVSTIASVDSHTYPASNMNIGPSQSTSKSKKGSNCRSGTAPRKSARRKPAGTASYRPNIEHRVLGNIEIPKDLIQQMKSTTTYDFDNLICNIDHKGKSCKHKGGCDGVVVYLNIQTAMQFNDEQTKGEDNTKIFNSGLINKNTSNDIYLMIEKIEQKEDNQSVCKQKYEWKMNYYNRPTHHHLPQRVSDTDFYKDQLRQKEQIYHDLMEPRKRKRIIFATKWTRIQILNSINNKRRKCLQIQRQEFQKDISKKDFSSLKRSDLFPILMFTGNGYKIHYVILFEVDNGTNIGISFIYDNKSKQTEVIGIHIDKSLLIRQHQWIACKDCKCLSSFISSFNCLEIGDPNSKQNEINLLREEIDMLRICRQDG